jgi:DNA-directed RNA polymerase beta subunit
MTEDYNLRQRKIYEDYVGYSTNSLMEMMKSEKYAGEVTDVLEDILVERNVIPKKNIQENSDSQVIENEETDKKEAEEYISNELKEKELDVNFYLKQLESSSDKDIAEIITKYASYQPASVEAALITAESRGTISSDEKEELLHQIEKGFDEYNRKEEAKAQVKIKKSSIQINSGFVMVLIGIILTIGTWVHPIGGYSIIFYGFIVSGVFLIYKGFFMSN